ncbi:MAG TPA: hypothetical protein VGG05_16450 [Pseudonocardiaceae bacterium]|jgi:hypothetical protein
MELTPIFDELMSELSGSTVGGPAADQDGSGPAAEGAHRKPEQAVDPAPEPAET